MAMLQSNTPPPAPNMPGSALTAGAAPAMAAMAPQQAQSPMAAQQPPQAPAPTHGQTVAALRHFTAIQNELETLLKDPAIGKSDIRSAIIDGTTKLVAGRIIKPAEAVTQLGTVPDRPFEQRAWVQQHLASIMQARNAVLDHHRAAFAGAPDVNQTANPDDHMKDMAALVGGHYGGRRAG